MKKKAAEFFSTPRRRLAAAFGALGVTWLVLLIVFGGGVLEWIPRRSRIDEFKTELKKQKKMLETVQIEEKAFERLRSSYENVIAEAWKEAGHGAVETALRQMVSDAATRLELKPTSLGTVRTSRINNEFYYAEIDVAMNCSLEEAVKFIAAVGEIRPVLSWRRIDLRPDFRPPRIAVSSIAGASAASRSGSSAAAQNSAATTRMVFNGAIRVIGYDGKPLPATPNARRTGR